MGFGEAFLNLQVLYQTLFDTQIVYDVSQNRFIPNPKLKTSWKTPVLNTTVNAIIPNVTCVVWHMRYLDAKVNGETVEPGDILAICLPVMMILQTLLISYKVDRNLERFAFTTSEVLKIGGINNRGWPSSCRLPDLQEVIGYFFASALGILVPVGIIYPLLMPNGVEYVYQKNFLSEIRRYSVPIYCGCFSFYTAHIFTQFVLLLFTCCQVFERETKTNLMLSKGDEMKTRSCWLEKLVRAGATTFFRALEMIRKKKQSDDSEEPVEIVVGSEEGATCPHFNWILRRHRCLSILMAETNEIMKAFILGLAAIGIAIGVGSSYVIVTMHDTLGLDFIVGICFVLIICVGWLNMLFYRHASYPLVNAMETIWYWRRTLTSKGARMKLKTMRVIGFALGPFFLVNDGTVKYLF
ncbi:unnamed protein product [Orchesella dallaii]|uniref:Odorant receptor n=1 Tax=Orchesella dallaii TaxID=48710 RepID=A0ABP1QCL9_9HEXA